MDRTRWTIFAIVCIVMLGGLVFVSKKDKVNVDTTNPYELITDSSTSIGDHVFGKKDSKVIVVEYGDFQCPGCGSAFPQLKTVAEKYKDKIAFVFRNFPLTAIHPNALAGATAAEAASLQGKYWEMHDKLYENQQDWSNVDASKRTDVFVGYAQEVGLNVDKFKADLTDKRIAEKISRDRALGTKLGVDSTPTIYVNQHKLDSTEIADLANRQGEKLTTRIDNALKANK